MAIFPYFDRNQCFFKFFLKEATLKVETGHVLGQPNHWLSPQALRSSKRQSDVSGAEITASRWVSERLNAPVGGCHYAHRDRESGGAVGGRSSCWSLKTSDMSLTGGKLNNKDDFSSPAVLQTLPRQTH